MNESNNTTNNNNLNNNPKTSRGSMRQSKPEASFSEEEAAQRHDPNSHKTHDQAILRSSGATGWARRDGGPLDLGRRWSGGDPGVLPVPLRQDHHDQLLPLLAVPLGSADEVVRAGAFQLHGVVPALVLFDRARGVAAEIAVPRHLQHRVLLPVVLPHWKKAMKKSSLSDELGTRQIREVSENLSWVR